MILKQLQKTSAQLLIRAIGIKPTVVDRITNVSETLQTQKMLGTLQLSTIKAARILVLQKHLFYTTWFWSAQWIKAMLFF
jgi:O-succinylbenzoate synthase